MRTRWLPAAAVTTATALAVAGFFGGAAGAQAPDEQGWWTAANPGPSTLGVTPPAQPPPPPGVPANGLLVEGGQSFSSPVAYAGLVFYLTSDATVSSLTLQVAPDSGTTPDVTLELCPLSQRRLQPEQGGPMADAPPYTCDQHVTAGPSPSGDSYQFDVSSLVVNEALAVAILPMTPTDRVVFSQPGTDSLVVSPGAGTGGTGADAAGSNVNTGASDNTVTETPAPAANGQVGGVAVPGSPTYSSPPAGSATVAAGGSPIVAPAPEHGQAVAGSSAVAPPPIAISQSEGAEALVVILVILGALVAAAAWISAGNAAIRAAATNLARLRPAAVEPGGDLR